MIIPHHHGFYLEKIKNQVLSQIYLCPLSTYRMVPPSYKLVYKPHENYSYLRTINHSEMGVICTNLANYGAPPCTVAPWGSFVRCSVESGLEGPSAKATKKGPR